MRWKAVGRFGSTDAALTHADISAFAVRPGSQGRGIGHQLLKHCTDQVDSQYPTKPIRLIALSASHEMCMRLGFKDVEWCDMDLDMYDSQKRGFGVYRQWSMIREVS